MKAITRRQLIREAIPRFLRTYENNPRSYDKTGERCKAVRLLDPETCTKEDIDAAVGNISLARNECTECREDFDSIIHLGDEPDYESDTVYICHGCLKMAIQMLEDLPVTPP